MSFVRVALFTLICHYLLPHLGFCKAYQNCLVALNKITTVETEKYQIIIQSSSRDEKRGVIMIT